MKHYKVSNEIRAIEEGQEFLIKDDWIELSDEELQAIINPPKTQEQIQAELIAHFKSLYMGVVDAKLKEKDYDSLATVKLWADDAVFGTEATAILDWYKAIISYNYGLLNSGNVPTDEEYLSGMPVL